MEKGCYKIQMAGKFIKSAVNSEGWPQSKLLEVGIIGRSNVGKSSLINAMAGQRNLARVSSTPGKTDLLNFYEIDGKFTLVDMPGYGYAARSQKVSKAWTPMIEGYLQSRSSLKGVILVMDVRRDWSEDEENLVEWLDHYGVKLVVAANKVDQLNQKEFAQRQKVFSNLNGVQDVIYTSTRTPRGVDELLRTIFEKILRT